MAYYAHSLKSYEGELLYYAMNKEWFDKAPTAAFNSVCIFSRFEKSVHLFMNIIGIFPSLGLLQIKLL